MAGVAASLTRAAASGSFMFDVRMPWETTPALRLVFSDDVPGVSVPLIVPRNLPPVPSIDRPEEFSLDRKKAEIRRSCYVSAENFPDESHANVLLKWVEIVLTFPEQSRVGRQMLEDFDRAKGSEDQQQLAKSFQIVSDSLRPKSTSTLKVRATSARSS